MRMADTKASMAVLMAGLLVVGGTGTILVAVNPFYITASSPMDPMQHYNMTVRVGAMVEGREIPIIGADLSVWSCSVNKTNDSVVITFTRVAHIITEKGGNATFNLPAGQYIIVANYSGLQSIKRVSLDGDMSIDALLHNYHHSDVNRECTKQRHHHDHDEDENGCRDKD